MPEFFVAVLAALIVHDLVRYGAAKLNWRLSVNKMYGGFRPPPLHVQMVRAVAGAKLEGWR